MKKDSGLETIGSDVIREVEDNSELIHKKKEDTTLIVIIEAYIPWFGGKVSLCWLLEVSELTKSLWASSFEAETTIFTKA